MNLLRALKFYFCRKRSASHLSFIYKGSKNKLFTLSLNEKKIISCVFQILHYQNIMKYILIIKVYCNILRVEYDVNIIHCSLMYTLYINVYSLFMGCTCIAYNTSILYRTCISFLAVKLFLVLLLTF